MTQNKTGNDNIWVNEKCHLCKKIIKQIQDGCIGYSPTDPNKHDWHYYHEKCFILQASGDVKDG